MKKKQDLRWWKEIVIEKGKRIYRRLNKELKKKKMEQKKSGSEINVR